MNDKLNELLGTKGVDFEKPVNFVRLLNFITEFGYRLETDYSHPDFYKNATNRHTVYIEGTEGAGKTFEQAFINSALSFLSNEKEECFDEYALDNAEEHWADIVRKAQQTKWEI